MEIPYTVEVRPDTGALQRQDGHLVVPGVRGDVVWGAVFELCHPADWQPRLGPASNERWASNA